MELRSKNCSVQAAKGTNHITKAQNGAPKQKLFSSSRQRPKPHTKAQNGAEKQNLFSSSRQRPKPHTKAQNGAEKQKLFSSHHIQRHRMELRSKNCSGQAAKATNHIQRHRVELRSKNCSVQGIFLPIVLLWPAKRWHVSCPYHVLIHICLHMGISKYVYYHYHTKITCIPPHYNQFPAAASTFTAPSFTPLAFAAAGSTFTPFSFAAVWVNKENAISARIHTYLKRNRNKTVPRTRDFCNSLGIKGTATFTMKGFPT